ncbi:MAG: thiol-disulfide oxidoreductase DCC family protein [Crocinitomicaceae bacterium]
MPSNNFSIVFYDGDCGFCNQSIQTILKHRKHNNFQFTALQSKLAQELLAPYHISISMETIYVLQNNTIYQKSNAILLLANELKGLYFLLKIGYLIPRFIRDGIYQLISKNRHRIKTGFCVVPSKAEKKLFKN